ncbi:MAG: hypothetical protein KKH52_04335 [Nanoarchaeota archaeon]|nr:hypothetical protein [Nanoarchaeota archaeon]MBU1622449.1 hypothetical protein [Nanoarchaeota archaeon]MBU1974596.1 hypothetical protein [Nanoarchaeota archaeon]
MVRRNSMHSQTKLLLIPLSGEETTELAEDMFNILREDFALGDQVEALVGVKRADLESGILKDHRHPLVLDYFVDGEIETDIGRNALKDVVRGKHVVLIEHLLTPNRVMFPNSGDPQRVSPNDHHMTVRGALKVFSKVDLLQITGCFPYQTYVRPHSVEKYETAGFFQFDSLALTLEDLVKGGMKAFVTVDPHSDKAAQIANSLGLSYHAVNPFQSGRTINPHKLGLSGERTEKVMKRLRPYQNCLEELKESGKNIHIVIVDDGTEPRGENFADRAFPELPPEEFYSIVVYLGKGRPSLTGETKPYIKPFTQARIDDPDGIYVLPDDMSASTGTCQQVAKMIKKAGGGCVEVWTTHAVTMPSQYEKANDRKYIDRIRCLDTVPQSENLDMEFIKASGYLLSSEVYKVHQRLVASR